MADSIKRHGLVITLLVCISILLSLLLYPRLKHYQLRQPERYTLKQTPTLTITENHALVRPRLPTAGEPEAACYHRLGPFEDAPELSLTHLEGAVGATQHGFYVISGFSHYVESLLMSTSRVDRLNVQTLHWEPLEQPSPIIASHIQGATDHSRIWISGGFLGQHPGRATAMVWQFEPESGQWSELPSLPTPRASGAHIFHEGALHYIGGLNADRYTPVTEHLRLPLDPVGQWQKVADFAQATNHFQVVNLGGTLFAVGGQLGHDRGHVDTPYLSAYYPATGTPDANDMTGGSWLDLQPLPNSRSHAEAATLVANNRIIVMGGRTEGDQSRSLTSVVEYNPYSNTWRTIGQLPQQLYAPVATFIDNQLYVAGGGRIWSEPQTNAWTANIEFVCDD